MHVDVGTGYFIHVGIKSNGIVDLVADQNCTIIVMNNNNNVISSNDVQFFLSVKRFKSTLCK